MDLKYNGWNQASKSNKIWGLSFVHFTFGKSIRKHQTMVKLQLVTNAKAKSKTKRKINYREEEVLDCGSKL